MPTQKHNSGKHLINEHIEFLDDQRASTDLLTTINQQIRQTNINNSNLLQLISPGLYLLTVSNPHINDPLRMKRLTDRVQYSVLPKKTEETICKLNLSQLRNHGHTFGPSVAAQAHSFLKNKLNCQMLFFYELGYVERTLLEHLEKIDMEITEVLTNRVVILSNGEFSYPLSLAKLVARAIWQNNPVTKIVESELAIIDNKFILLRDLYSALKRRYHQREWSLVDGKMTSSEQGFTKGVDYPSLLDDIIYASYEKRMDEYLSFFRLSDLDTTSSFPTAAVRSPVHLKARPFSLSRMENGYATAAASESNGKQTPITYKDRAPAQTFSLWMRRATRHLFRHQYRARVVFLNSPTQNVFALVGEQVATIALFPALVKGVFESLNLTTPSSVRLIAHNEDVLTIAHDTASWVDINNVNERATSMFRMVSTDGADPLSLFEHVLLPSVGVGTFQLRVVPDAFFELIDAAHSSRLSIPQGHDHYLRGLGYECLHEWGMAVGEFQKALRYDSHDPEVLHALGRSYVEIGQVKESLPFLKRAFDLMPDDAEIANDWGVSNMECGMLTDAIIAFEHAVRLNPSSADYLKNLGRGYLLAARPVDAMLEFTKAIDCDPHSADAHASLAHLYLENGDEKSAKRHAMIAYNENPVDVNIANMLWRLTLGKK